MIMKRVLTASAFHTLLFCIVVLLFNWPVLTVFEEKFHAAIWIYLYVLWLIVVVMLLLIAICHKTETRPGNKNDPS